MAEAGGPESAAARCPDESSDSEPEQEPGTPQKLIRKVSTSGQIRSKAAVWDISQCDTQPGRVLGDARYSCTRGKAGNNGAFRGQARGQRPAAVLKSIIFDEVDLTDASVAESSTKNVNNSFTVRPRPLPVWVRPSTDAFRAESLTGSNGSQSVFALGYVRLILCADNRKEMEEWMAALRSVQNRQNYESTQYSMDHFSGMHNWYACSHARPTYCNVCREALSGVTSHGLSCEACAVRATNNCKWTTLASIGKDIIEDEDGVSMPHQWLEGNLPVSAKCHVCDKTCGSVLRLQDWRCLWCKAMSGDNQGVKFLRRFKQLLNPAQVFDLMNGGPHLGLRLFQKFDTFRILVCGGDGSVGWVLSEIDALTLHKQVRLCRRSRRAAAPARRGADRQLCVQCQLGVLPLGTGNDLARVLGWGSACDDDTQLPQILEKLERASTKMLDRWSIMVYETKFPRQHSVSTVTEDCSEDSEVQQILTYEDSVAAHLSKILTSDQHSVVISSAKVLCETVKDFVARVGKAYEKNTESSEESEAMAKKCGVLKEKLDSLLKTLNEESQASSVPHLAPPPTIAEEQEETEGNTPPSPLPHHAPPPPLPHSCSSRSGASPAAAAIFKPREQLMLRANSLKKAIRQIIEHTEKVGKTPCEKLMGKGSREGTPLLSTKILYPGQSCAQHPHYAGGTNFWGGTKEDDTFTAPSFDDKILEVVAVFGSMQMVVSRVINLQHHRIAQVPPPASVRPSARPPACLTSSVHQCRTVKITILGDEGVPVQVDGEAWVQPPGYIKIIHKNRTQTLTRDRPEIVSEEEASLISEFGQAAGALIHSIREVAQCHHSLEQELAHAVNASSKAMDLVYANSKGSGTLGCGLVLQMVFNVKVLLRETELLLAGKMSMGPLTDFSKRSRIHQWGTEEVGAWLDFLCLTEYKDIFTGHDVRGAELLHLERRDLKVPTPRLLPQWNLHFLSLEPGPSRRLGGAGLTVSLLLQDLGVTKVGHMKRILQGIRELNRSSSASEA
ncbi:unnamed protein product [Tetraodon nigroviridis]|uniref:Diacylglycerol kinase n=1 Tax=Tetraodon nigroviridis TaxID=99883 RepID=Q4SB55_TETNG|nr:unnamed protein product [Tetraodon nigroviridis]